MKTLFIFLVSSDAFQQIRNEIPLELLQNENVFLNSLDDSDMKNITFPMDSQVYSFYRVNDTIEVNEHYNIANQSQVIRKVGMWKNGQPWELPLNQV